MSQQHEGISQHSFEADEESEYSLDADQPLQFAPRVKIVIELRFAIALFSVIVLLTMSVVNMVIERLLETVLYGLGPYIPSAFRLLGYTLPPLALAILVTLLLIWINALIARRTRRTTLSRPDGEKLIVSRPPSMGQRLSLACITAGLAVPLWYTATIYLRFGPYLSSLLSEASVARLAAIPIFTAAWLAGAALWINIMFHRRRS